MATLPHKRIRGGILLVIRLTIRFSRSDVSVATVTTTFRPDSLPEDDYGSHARDQKKINTNGFE
ncbi:MAG: hypothetical protein ABGZ53_28825 [Fuerstiella sp.]